MADSNRWQRTPNDGSARHRLLDTDLSPSELGRLAFARGQTLADCPYDDPVPALQWQQSLLRRHDLAQQCQPRPAMPDRSAKKPSGQN